MNKRKQLIEYITQDIVAFIVNDTGKNISDAVHIFFSSETYEKLCDEETGLYLESSAYVYDIYQRESIEGKIVQNEY
ncbi:MAG: hypothetical protein PHS74_09610 [Lachnospiraceae bacterium]|nr:hypothetical protein [Lachnospiraceae bacterium]